MAQGRMIGGVYHPRSKGGAMSDALADARRALARLARIAAMRGAKANDALALYVKRLSGQLASEAKFTAALVDDKIQKGGDDAPPPVDDDQGE